MATVKSMTPSKPVVVAKSDLHAGQVIKEDDIIVKKYPTSVLPEGAVADRKGIIGKTLKKDVFEGEVLRIKHLTASTPIPAQLEGYCPKGWGAVELPLGTAEGMKTLRPGDRVDVFGEIPVVQGDKVGKTVGKIAEDAVVLITPEKEGRDTYVVAVAPESIPALAEAVVNDKKLAVVVVNQ